MGIRISGLSSGLDTAKLIDALMTLEKRPLTLVQNQKQDIQNQKSLFDDLSSKLDALSKAAGAIDNLSSGLSGPSVSEEFLAWKAASSDESVLSARVTGTATPATTSVRVVSLATSARRVSGAFASDTDVVANEGDTLDVSFGGTAPISLTVGAGGASLRDLASQINADTNNGGAVRADVVYDGSGYRLVVIGGQTGAAHDVAVTTSIAGPGGAAFLDAAAGQAAADAQLQVYGLSVTRPSNTVTDLVPGVTLELHAASATPVQVQVERDDTAVGDKLQALVDAYNAVVDFANTQSRFDPTTKTAGPLSGDSVLRDVQMRIQRVMVRGVSIPGNPVNSLAAFGLSFDSEGHLALDRDKLTSSLVANAPALRQALVGDGTNDGLALALEKGIAPLIEAQTGLLAGRASALDARIEGLDRSIANLQDRLDKRQAFLEQQFATLESTLSALQSQGSSISNIGKSS